MTIRFIKQWNMQPVGRVVSLGGGVADLLIRRKIAVEVKPQRPVEPGPYQRARMKEAVKKN